MRRIALALSILALMTGSASCVWADDLAMAAIPPDSARLVLSGVVKSVSWANPAKGTKSEIVVIDAARKPVNILVTGTTTLWDSDAKAIMPDEIVVRRHVNIIYLTTPEGINVAQSIKILK